MRALVSLERATLAVHGVLILAVAAAVGVSSWPRLAATVALTAPLLLALPGVARASRYTCQWLAVVLVLYAGAASVEVVAAAGAAVAAALTLLAALTELALLLALIRAAPPTARE